MFTYNYLKEIDIKFALLKRLREVDPRKIGDKLLLEYHRKAHMLYMGNIKRKNVNRTFIKFIVDFHNDIVKEMDRRGFQHRSPLEVR